MKLKKLVMVGMLFLIVFSFGFASAKSCEIRNSCDSSNTVMRLSTAVAQLSSVMNAHGALYNQGSYNNFLCCDFAGVHASQGDNKVIGLSSFTNAHAEIPTLANYGTGVYFGDLECAGNRGGCLFGYDIEMVSLSSETNAHIGSFGSYDVKVCCRSGGPSEIASGVYWADSYGERREEASLGERVYMIATGVASGTFEIWEKDWGIAGVDILADDERIRMVDDGNIIGENFVGSWEITQEDLEKTDGDYDYDNFYFKIGDSESGFLKVNVPVSVLESGAYWADTDGNAISEADFGDTVQMIAIDVASGVFDIREDDSPLVDDPLGVLDDEIRDGIVGVSVGDDLVGNWTIEQRDLDETLDYDEFYFKVGEEESGYLEVDVNGDDDPMEIAISGFECGEDFNVSEKINISVVIDDLDDMVSGNVTFDGEFVGVFGNEDVNFTRVLSSPGSFQIVAEAVNSRGKKGRAISNIMVLERNATGGYVDGDYVATCIAEPRDFSNIEGTSVKFNASTTRAIRVREGVIEEILPGSESLSWYWKFMPEGVTRAFEGSNDLLAYLFTQEFSIAGENSASLRVDLI